MTPEHVNIVVAATCCLHNFLTNSPSYWSQDELRETVNEGLVNLPIIKEVIHLKSLSQFATNSKVISYLVQAHVHGK